MVRTRKPAAFTLIEIMVVITIIILLVALLLPVLSKARASANRAAALSQMSGISTACESYYQMFRAYPGMLAENSYDGGAALNFSSSQALVVSLSRFFCTPNPDGGASATLAITGVNPATYVSSDPSVSPRDYSENTVVNTTTNNVTGRQYSPFMNTSLADLSNSITSPGTPLSNFPTFIDKAYGSLALPIVYYRAARKYDPSTTGGMQPVAPTPTSTPPGGFYATSNGYLGSATVMSAGNVTYQASKINSLDAATLGSGAHLLTETINGADTVRGSFVLISAGPDRIFGTPDDIVLSGG